MRRLLICENFIMMSSYNFRSLNNTLFSVLLCSVSKWFWVYCVIPFAFAFEKQYLKRFKKSCCQLLFYIYILLVFVVVCLFVCLFFNMCTGMELLLILQASTLPNEQSLQSWLCKITIAYALFGAYINIFFIQI